MACNYSEPVPSGRAIGFASRTAPRSPASRAGQLSLPRVEPIITRRAAQSASPVQGASDPSVAREFAVGAVVGGQFLPSHDVPQREEGVVFVTADIWCPRMV